MFQMMYDSINFEVAEIIFKIQPVEKVRPVKGVFSSLPQNLVHQEIAGMADTAARAPQQTPPPEMAPQGGPPPPGMPASPIPAESEKQVPIRKDGPKVGRNDPCPCGSGKKYKKCCGR